jgi:hypothetical protein
MDVPCTCDSSPVEKARWAVRAATAPDGDACQPTGEVGPAGSRSDARERPALWFVHGKEGADHCHAESVASPVAEHLVATGRAPSVSAVINDVLTDSYTRHRRGQRLLRGNRGMATRAVSSRRLATLGYDPAGLESGGRGTTRGTSTSSIPVQCALSGHSHGAYAQVARPVRPGSPLLIRGFGDLSPYRPPARGFASGLLPDGAEHHDHR